MSHFDEIGNYHKAFGLFRLAEDMTRNIQPTRVRYFFKAIFQNNIANYYHHRKKFNATARYAKEALKSWKKVGVNQLRDLLIMRYGTAANYAGRFQESYSRFIKLSSPKKSTKKNSKIPYEYEFKFIERIPIDVNLAVQFLTLHNAAIAQVAYFNCLLMQCYSVQ